MATLSTPHLLTAEEYGQLDEVIGFRDELIEGERVLSPNAVSAHAALIKHLERLLEKQLPQFSNEPLQVVRETGLKLRPSSGADSVPAPDLMVVPEGAWLSAVKKRSWFDGVPLMVFEVISPSERRARRMQKVGLYLEIGIPYVVEVDYTRRVVLVHTPAGDAATVYRADDQITDPFQASIGEIFAILD